MASSRRPRAPADPEDTAFLLRVSPYGEADAVVRLFTARSGVVSAIGKRARRRMVLEPFHTLSVSLARGSGELSSLRSAQIAHARVALLGRADAMDAAGTCTRWTRSLAPEHTPEPVVFAALERAFDAFDRGESDPRAVQASFGLVLLEALGFGLELAACARCGRPRPAGRAALLAGRQGGVVCATCRGGAEALFVEIAGPALDEVLGDRWCASALALLGVVTTAVEARAER